MKFGDLFKDVGFFSTSALSLIQFIAHLTIALSDGELSYAEMQTLMSSASGVQVLILMIAFYIFNKKQKGSR